jgi:hypothetical protein
MRFFQHYLMYCYPHHPIGSEDVWLHEIPCLSHKVFTTWNKPSHAVLPRTKHSSSMNS